MCKRTAVEFCTVESNLNGELLAPLTLMMPLFGDIFGEGIFGDEMVMEDTLGEVFESGFVGDDELGEEAFGGGTFGKANFDGDTFGDEAFGEQVFGEVVFDEDIFGEVTLGEGMFEWFADVFLGVVFGVACAGKVENVIDFGDVGDFGDVSDLGWFLVGEDKLLVPIC